MKAHRNISYGNRAGGHNNSPAYPVDTEVKNSHAGKGCLPVIIAISTLIIAGVLASAFLFIPWWVESQTNQYTGFSNTALAGTITIARTEQSNVSHVSLTTTIEGGTLKINSSYLLPCKELGLSAVILSTPAWIHTQSHYWFQLTSIEGKQCRDPHGKPQASMNTPINGADDSYRVNVQKGGGWGILISTKEISSNFVPVDGTSYQVIVTPNSLSLIAGH